MAAKFAKDEGVRISKPLDGKVVQVKFNEDTGEPRYLVSWNGDNGVEHQRWFAEAELSVIPA